ncbi:MAG: hypothetical protein HYX92_18160 [Chloroflexi bacterium]|nr:hypothetical protein [Chloroflexota bacterium]
MEQRFVDVLDPVGEVEAEELGLAPRPASLKAKVVGLLSSSNRVMDMLGDRFEELIREKYGAVEFVRHRERGAPTPELMDKLARECDVVIGGIGV